VRPRKTGAPVAAPPARHSRGRPVVWWVVGALVALLLIAVAGVLLYSQVGVMAAEPAPLAAVRADDRITVEENTRAIVLSPTAENSEVGLVYIPGAKVDPWAYAAKMSGAVAEGGITVVITKPWLNLAFFDLRPLSVFTELAPHPDRWIVAGHSLGGVRACQLTGDADALALFASYCANDVSGSGLPVLSIGGSADGLSTPQKIADARHLLPADAEIFEIDGASHASFGDYGTQPGDGTATISDDDMTAQITELVDGLAATLG
jgi:pimeloyl-ACP methyl ester carboxylesterase